MAPVGNHVMCLCFMSSSNWRFEIGFLLYSMFFPFLFDSSFLIAAFLSLQWSLQDVIVILNCCQTLSMACRRSDSQPASVVRVARGWRGSTDAVASLRERARRQQRGWRWWLYKRVADDECALQCRVTPRRRRRQQTRQTRRQQEPTAPAQTSPRKRYRLVPAPLLISSWILFFV